MAIVSGYQVKWSCAFYLNQFVSKTEETKKSYEESEEECMYINFICISAS